MRTAVGIHAMERLPDVSAEDFESVMAGEIFPAAAETPGSVSRGGQSTIERQYLLRESEADRKYLWVVESSGVFSEDLFARVFDRMYEDSRERIDGLATHVDAKILDAVGTFAAGPRDELGRVIEQPPNGEVRTDASSGEL